MSTRPNPRVWQSVRGSVVAGLAAVAMAGCSVNPIYNVTGQVLTGYSETEATPYVLAMNDVGMACALGESVDPLVSSFSRVTAPPESTGSLLALLSGICAERVAVEEDLRYRRAEFNDNVTEMRDARTNSRRKYGETAQRRLVAFNRAMSAYDFDPTTDTPSCPCFKNDQAELTFLLGLLSGAQAVLDDAKAGGRAGVSRSLAPQIERAATCVDSEKWAGLPENIRAAVWVLLPDTRPDEDINPWDTMKANRQLAVAGGLRAAVALELAMAENVGDEDTIAEALAFLAASEDDFEVRAEYALVDFVGMEVVLAVSDRIWTKRYGYRTPGNRFGRIETGRAPREDIDTDGLL